MEASHSPIINKPQTDERTLTFPQAMEEVIKGNAVTRLEWNNKKSYAYLSKITHYLTIKNDAGDDLANVKQGQHAWVIREGDLLAIDWVVVSQQS